MKRSQNRFSERIIEVFNALKKELGIPVKETELARVPVINQRSPFRKY